MDEDGRGKYLVVSEGLDNSWDGGLHYPDSAEEELFGGHEFHYEAHTDLFRCIRCHMYEVTARADGPVKPCTGQPPEGAGPIEVNAF